MWKLPQVAAASIGAAAVAAGAVAYVLFPSGSTQSTCGPAAELTAAGFPQDVTDILCSATTALTSAEGRTYRYQQRIPALDLRRDITIRVEPDQAFTLDPSEVAPGTELDAVPLRLLLIPFEGGYARFESFFVLQ